jgi:hypothetical protein
MSRFLYQCRPSSSDDLPVGSTWAGRASGDDRSRYWVITARRTTSRAVKLFGILCDAVDDAPRPVAPTAR